MYWNIDFEADAGFSTYVVLLALSGLILLFLGANGLGSQTKAERIINVLVGLAFGGYGFYLAFLFDGGTYWIVFKAFIVPAVLIFNVLRNAVTRRKEQAAAKAEAQNLFVTPPQQPVSPVQE